MPPRLNAQRVQPAPQAATRYNYAVRTIRAQQNSKGIEFVESGEFQCGPDAQNAKAAADRLQREFDADCDPCRTYVVRGGDPVPVYAGLQPDGYRGYRG